MNRGHLGGPSAPPEIPSTVTLEGTLERIVFVNEENGWVVLRLDVPERFDPVTAVGFLPGVQPGESLRLTGQWVQDRKFGEQFRVHSFVTVNPATLLGIERYLGSGLVRGVGKVMASRLVKHFKYETLEVIDRDPERLTEVEGIGFKRKERILAAWTEQKAVKDVMVFLQSHGVSTGYAVKIYKQYGANAITVVQENPYRLAVDIHGIGFKTADKIAANLGIPPTSLRRAEAGLIHVLGALSDEGHVYCPEEALIDRAVALLEIDRASLAQGLANLVTRGKIHIETDASGTAVYLTFLHNSESGATRQLLSILATPASPFDLDLDRAFTLFEEQSEISLAPQQREAVRCALRSKVLVITGGPGTGKTTIVNGILRIMLEKRRRVLLCAPTGRAAKRLADTTGHEARTMHRLLEFNPRNGGFDRNDQRRLEADVIIVDEMSMVDLVLFYHLLKATPPICQLILVGDADQLPSVGPGNVLLDLIRSSVVDVVRLTEIFRQAQESLIVVNAHRVNRGEMPVATSVTPVIPVPEKEEDKEGENEREDPRPQADFFFIEREEPEAILSTLKELVSRRIPVRFCLNPVEEIQILTPMHKGILGTINLNAQLQNLLNPEGESLVRGSRVYRVGDKVMQICNNYDLEVFNGDLGQIVAIDPVDHLLRVRIDERLVPYDFANLDELVLGYACSIHKSQGSEYPAVVIPLHTQHYTMLQRNLLYTAITRGRRLVVLVGSRKALAISVGNASQNTRLSHLAERLRNKTCL